MDKNNIIREKSYAFAIRIVNAYKFLTESKKEFVLSKQLLRSGTAVGALVAEAIFAQSGPDFLNKMNVALKEANETGKWLEMLLKTEYIDEATYKSIDKTCSTIRILLIASIKTAKSRINK